MSGLNKIVISDIAEALTVKAYTGRNMKIENRKFFGLSFCKSGKITYTHNGRQTVSHSGNAVILPMGASYELYNNRGGEFPLINFYCEGEDFTDEFITIPIDNIEVYIKDFERICEDLLWKEKRLKCISVLYDVFYRLSLEADNAAGVLPLVKRYIDKNIGDVNLSNALIADYAKISEIYLRKLFKKRYNITPKQYILEMRIKLAKQLLSQTGKSVTEVSMACGFAGVYHFCRAFKDKTGLTPSHYREIYRFNGI